MNQNLQGREYWRSLSELAHSPEIADALSKEFPHYDPVSLTGTSRRSFLRLMAASMALAGLTLSGCRRWPAHEVRPNSSQPEGTMPGVPQYYASMMELGGVATGLLVKSYDGRPIKVEGNPLHPFSLGAAGAFAQASVLEMYDPARAREITELVDGKRVSRNWDEFSAFAKKQFSMHKGAKGKGLVILSRPTGSPTVQRLREQIKKDFPEAQWISYEPFNRDNELAGAKLAFGQPVRTQYKVDEAKVIGCFDADLLGLHPAHQRYAREWARNRATGELAGERGKMNRVYAIETNYSLTGSVADMRLPVRPSFVGKALAYLAMKVGALPESAVELEAGQKSLLDQLARDLQEAKGESIVAVGASQPSQLHALAHLINGLLGNIGKTVSYTTEPLYSETPSLTSCASLSESLRGGKVNTLLILDANPLYDLPGDIALNLASATTIHLSTYVNETSAKCNWHVPLAHFLESWGDGTAWDGTYSVQQPLILPLFDGKSSIELLSLVLDSNVSAMDAVRQTAKEKYNVSSDETWSKLLHDGILDGSAWPGVNVSPVKMNAVPLDSPGKGFELQFVPHACVYDGRFSDNGWLQELPDPMTKLTWDNAALINKSDADAMNITTGDVISIESDKLTLQIAAYVMPGIPRGAIVLPLGFGRTAGGHIAPGIGFNCSAIRHQATDLIAGGASVSRTGGKYALALTQEHHLIDAIGMAGRTERVGEKGKSGLLIREASLEEFKNEQGMFQEHEEAPKQLFEPPATFRDPHAWGMAIDLNACTGCGACIVACQAENNIPIVGKTQVANHREMHWLRVDRYFKGDVENPDVVHSPVACVQCENAPCEQVCPVAATVHDSEGLNTMVYNRCIGTRYCSNNCPYKVRRFNYFDFHANDPRGTPKPWIGIPDEQQRTIDSIKQMLFNPEVTVRMRGVMEKCTYCVQRISAAKVHARVEHENGLRESEIVADGEVATACQGACPTQAIKFGNLNDKESKVSKAQEGNRSYAMLEHLNLRPRTLYQAKLRNPAEEKKAGGVS